MLVANCPVFPLSACIAIFLSVLRALLCISWSQMIPQMYQIWHCQSELAKMAATDIAVQPNIWSAHLRFYNHFEGSTGFEFVAQVHFGHLFRKHLESISILIVDFSNLYSRSCLAFFVFSIRWTCFFFLWNVTVCRSYCQKKPAPLSSELIKMETCLQAILEASLELQELCWLRQFRMKLSRQYLKLYQSLRNNKRLGCQLWSPIWPLSRISLCILASSKFGSKESGQKPLYN